MSQTLLAFFLSFTISLAIIKSQRFHLWITGDHDLLGPQKFHDLKVPRVGGISIFISLVISSLVSVHINYSANIFLLLQLCLCVLPCFLIGIAEDLTKKISPNIRFLITAFSAYLSIYFVNISINSTQVIGLDFLLSIPAIAILFTIFAITGLANAYNIIDGFNGLASMVAMISLLAIGYVAFKVNDLYIASSCLLIVGAICGFFVWNYPRGLIFLGDGGSYLIGYMVATLSILLINRNSIVSPWFAVLVNAYPIFETIFTIWRRKVHQGKSPSLPDGAHFHSLIYRRVIIWTFERKFTDDFSYKKNSRTSPILWLLSCFAVFPAIIWWQSTLILQFFSLLFCISYVFAYRLIVKFKTHTIFRLFR